ncbi:hypothetical protein C8R48DRAFT_605611, partial [Suillus tomentosus]
LSHKVELAIRLEVMDTFNVKTYLDVENGEHGEIVDVVLNERETAYSEMSARVNFNFPWHMFL